VESEELRIELFNPVEDHARANILRVGESFPAHASREQLLLGKIGNRFDAVSKVFPERRRIPGSRKTAGHADDRYLRIIHRSQRPRSCFDGFAATLCARASHPASLRVNRLRPLPPAHVPGAQPAIAPMPARLDTGRVPRSITVALRHPPTGDEWAPCA